MLTLVIATFSFLAAAGYIAVLGKDYTRKERIRFLALSVVSGVVSGFIALLFASPTTSPLYAALYQIVGTILYWTVHLVLRRILPPETEDQSNKHKTRELIELERSYNITKVALLAGWIPFVLIGYISIGLLASVAAIDSIGTGISNYFESSLVKLFHGSSKSAYAEHLSNEIAVIVIFLVIGLIVFYAFAFRRAVKLKAKVSATSVQLDIETDKMNS